MYVLYCIVMYCTALHCTALYCNAMIAMYCTVLALRLSAVNKWCVTGTPVGKSLNDLYGLLLFLQVKILCYAKNIWHG